MSCLQFVKCIPHSGLALWLISGAQAPLTDSLSENPPRVIVDSGSLQGKRYGNDVEMFLGISYAAPPTGNLRWKPPAPVARWTGIREASAFGPVCPQTTDAVRAINEEAQDYSQLYPFYGSFRADEDCLSLNIWTTNTGGKTKMPVTYPPKGKYAGYRAYHGLELRFIAGVFRKSRWGEPDDEDGKLVEIMSSYWTQFARTGDPNEKGLPTWPVYDPQKDIYLEIGREVKVRPIHHIEKFPLFERSLQARIAEYQKSQSAEKH